jgi:hypothetical protein
MVLPQSPRRRRGCPSRASASYWTAAFHANGKALALAAPQGYLPVELAHEIVAGSRRLEQERSERAGFEGAVIGHGESCSCVVWVSARYGDVITLSHHNETEPLEGSDYNTYRSVGGELGR